MEFVTPNSLEMATALSILLFSQVFLGPYHQEDRVCQPCMQVLSWRTREARPGQSLLHRQWKAHEENETETGECSSLCYTDEKQGD